MEYKLNHIRLLVENYRDSVRFYEHTLGLPLLRGDLESGYAEFEAPGIRLGLLQRSAMSEALGMVEPKQEGRRHMAVAFAVDDVDAAFNELKVKGVKFTLAPRTHSDWNLRTAHFNDPDGNLIEINQRMG
jgi:catechol 2,3-dioxygenase-like lactoylglutathione lyase family enzyme